MQEHVQLKLTDELSAAVTSQDAARTQELRAFLYAHLTSVQKMVEGYWYARKGKVERLQVEESSLHFNTSSDGVFLVRYHVSFFFACDDITADTAETMWCTFSLDLKSGMAVLQGENQSERSVEEF